MAYEVLRMIANLDVGGTQKARREMQTTERSAKSLKTALDSLDRAGGSFRNLTRNLSNLRSEIQKTQAVAARGLHLKVTVDDRAANRSLNNFESRFNALNGRTATARLDVDSGAGDRKLDAFATKLRAANGRTSTSRLELDSSAADSQLNTFLSNFRALNGQTARVRVDADTSAVNTAYTSVLGMWNILDGYTANLRTTVDTTAVDMGEARVRAFLAWAGGQNATVNVHVQETGIAGVTAALLRLNSTAAEIDNRWGHSVRIHAEADNIESVIARIRTLGFEAKQVDDNDIEIDIDVRDAQARTRLEGLRALMRILSNEGVVLKADVDDVMAQTRLALLQQRLSALNGRYARIGVDADTMGAMTSLQALMLTMGRIGNQRIRVGASIDQSLTSALPNALGSVEKQIKSTQVAASAISQVQFPIMLASMGGIASGAVAAAGAVGAFAIQLGQGVAGAAGIAGTSLLLAGGAIGGYGLAIAQTMQYALDFNNVIKMQKDNVKDSTKAVGEAEAMLAEATPGTQEYANAQNAVAFATQDAAFQQDKLNAILANASPAMLSLNAATNEFRLAMIGAQGSIMNALAPALEYFVSQATSRIPLITPHITEMIDQMNSAAMAFTKTSVAAGGMAAIQTILMGVRDAGAQALEAFLNFGAGIVTIIAGAVPHALQLINHVHGISQSFAALMTSAQGMTTIGIIWGALAQKAGMLWQAAVNLAAGIWGVIVALNDTGIGQSMLAGIVSLSAGFRDLMSATGSGRQAIRDFMSDAEPSLARIVPLALTLGQTFLEAANKMIGMTNASTGMPIIAEILDSIARAAGPVASIFVHEFEKIGPLLPPLIDALAQWAAVFVYATPEMILFIQAITQVLEAFQLLSPETQQLLARMLAWTMVIGPLVSGLIGMAGTIFQVVAAYNMFNAVMSVAAAAKGAEHVTLLTRAFGALSTAGTALWSGLTLIGGAVISFGGALIALNPIAWAVVAAVAAVAGAAYLIYQNWGTIGPWLSGVWESIKNIVSVAYTAVLGVLQGIGGQIMAWWTTFWPTFIAPFQAAWDQIKAVASAVFTSIFGEASATWPGISAIISGAMSTISSIISTVLSGISALWSAVWPGLSTALGGVWTAISSIIQGGVDVILGIITFFAGALTGNWDLVWMGLTMVVSGVWTMISGIVQGGLQVLQGLFQAAAGWLGAVWGWIWQGLVTIFQPIWDGIVAAVTSGLTALQTLFTTAWTAITTAFSAAIGGLQIAWDTVWGGLTAGIQAGLAFLGTLFTTAWAAITAAFTTAITGLQTAWTTVWTAIVGFVTPILATLGQVIIVGLALIVGLIAMALEGWVIIFQTVWAAIQAGATLAWQLLTTIITTAINLLISIVTPIFQAFVAAINLAWAGIQMAATVAWTAIQTAIVTAWNMIVAIVTPIITAFVLAIQTAWTAIQTGATLAWTLIQTAIVTAWNMIIAVVTPIITAFVTAITAAWTAIQTGATIAWTAIQTVITTVWNAIVAFVTPILAAIVSAIAAGWEAVRNATMAAWTAIQQAIQAAWTAITGVISTAIAAAGAAITAGWTLIQTATTTAWTAIQTAIQAAWTAIQTLVQAAIDIVWNYITTAWTGIQTETTTIWDAIGAYIDQVWNAIYTTVETLITQVYDFIVTQWDAVASYTSEIYDGIATYLEEVWSGIYDGISGWLEQITTAASDTWDAIVEGVNGFGDTLYNTLEEVFTEAVSRGGEILAGILDGIAEALNGVGDPGGYAGTVSGAADSIRSATQFAEGGITGGGISSYAAGGMGTDNPQSRMHVWNEQMGNEAFIAERGPRQANVNYLKQAASWFGLAVVSPPGRTGKHEHGPRSVGHAEYARRKRNNITNAHANGGITAFARGGITGVSAFCDGGMSNVHHHDQGGYVRSDCSCAEKGMNTAFFALGGTSYAWDDDVGQIVSQLSGATGGCGTPNTYVGHPGGEGRSVDWWSGGRGGQLGYGCGNSLQSEGRSTHGSDLSYDIWQGTYSGTAGTYNYCAEDPYDCHYDHLHQTFGSEGGLWGRACTSIKGKIQSTADGLKETAKGSLSGIDVNAVRGFGEYGIDTAIQSIVDWLISKLPSCGGAGGGAGDCGAALAPALEQLGLTGSDFESTMPGLISCESGGDPNATNTWDSNAAAGTPSIGCTQMIQPTFDAYKYSGCDDIYDPLCNIMASIRYQQSKYGYAHPGCPYHTGGVIPGPDGADRMVWAQAGEAIIPRNAVGGFQELAGAIGGAASGPGTPTTPLTGGAPSGAGAAVADGGGGTGGGGDITDVAQAIYDVIPPQTSAMVAAIFGNAAQVVGSLFQTSGAQQNTTLQNAAQVVASLVSQETQTRTQMTSETEAANALITAEVAGLVAANATQTELQTSAVLTSDAAHATTLVDTLFTTNDVLTGQVQTTEQGIVTQISDTQQALEDTFLTLGDIITEKMDAMIALLEALPDSITTALEPLANIGTSITDLLAVTKQAWGLAAGGKISGPTPALVGEGNAPEYVIPTETRYRRRGRGLLADAASKLGLQVLDNKGRPVVMGGHTDRIIDGGGGRAHAREQFAGGSGGDLGWSGVTGYVMRYRDNTPYPSVTKDAVDDWNSHGFGAKILPHWGNNASVVMSMGTGDGWVGLATSSGTITYDSGFTARSGGAARQQLFGHEIGHQFGFAHSMGNSIMYPTVSGGTPNVTSEDVGRGRSFWGSAAGKPRVRSFLRGGLVPGSIPAPAILHGGERVLPRALASSFDNFADAIRTTDVRHGRAGEANGVNINRVEVKVHNDLSGASIGTPLTVEELEERITQKTTDGINEGLGELIEMRPGHSARLAMRRT